MRFLHLKLIKTKKENGRNHLWVAFVSWVEQVWNVQYESWKVIENENICDQNYLGTIGGHFDKSFIDDNGVWNADKTHFMIRADDSCTSGACKQMELK